MVSVRPFDSDTAPPRAPQRGGGPTALYAGMDAPADGDWVSALQQHLQRLAPASGCHAEELWRYDEPDSWVSGDRVRIVLLNTQHDVGHERAMEWSEPQVKRKPARHEAAMMALTALRISGDRPHDPNRAPTKVSAASSSQGAGGAPALSLKLAALPLLDENLLSVAPIVLMAKEASLGMAMMSHNGLAIAPDAASANSMTYSAVVHDQPRADEPANLGALGEEYAERWVNSQPWARSVTWLNRKEDMGLDHDLTCKPTAEPGRHAIEVKTKWRGSKVKMSKRQLLRLLDPVQDYMLLVIGDARNLFQTPAQPPFVRIIHSPPPKPAVASTKVRQGDQRRTGRSSARDLAMQAEALIEELLDGSAKRKIPEHVVEYVERVGIGSLRNQWAANRKRMTQQMQYEVAQCEWDSLQMASEALVELCTLIGKVSESDVELCVE